MTPQERGDEYERLIEAGEIEWSPVLQENLDEFTVGVCAMTPKGTTFEIGSVRLDNSFILKTSDPYLVYIDIHVDEELFAFCSEGHREGIAPSVASSYTVTKDNPQYSKKQVDDVARMLWPDHPGHNPNAN